MNKCSVKHYTSLNIVHLFIAIWFTEKSARLRSAKLLTWSEDEDGVVSNSYLA